MRTYQRYKRCYNMVWVEEKNLLKGGFIMSSPVFRRISAPTSLQIEVTSFCNAKCKHCYNGLMDGSFPRFMMSEEIANGIWQEIFDNQVRQIILTGGEPLLNWPITKFFMEKGRDYYYKVRMNSNVALLTDEIADELKELRINGISASLMSSTPKIHDKIAGVRGLCKKTIAGIELCLKKEIPVCVNMVLSKYNVHDISNTVSFLAKLGVKNISLTPASCPSRGLDFSMKTLTQDEILEVYNLTAKYSKEYNVQISPADAVPFCVMPKLSHGVIPSFFCAAGLSGAYVDPLGNLRACPLMTKTYGSIIEEPLTKVWPRLQDDWLKAQCVSKKCLNCKLFGDCGGGCHYLAQLNGGEHPLMDIELVDETEQILLDLHHDEIEHPVEIPKDGTFKLKPFTIRKENFGAIIWNELSTTELMVNRSSLVFLTSLLVDVPYKVSSVVTEENRDLFYDLYLNGFVTFEE